MQLATKAKGQRDDITVIVVDALPAEDMRLPPSLQQKKEQLHHHRQVRDSRQRRLLLTPARGQDLTRPGQDHCCIESGCA